MPGALLLPVANLFPTDWLAPLVALASIITLVVLLVGCVKKKQPRPSFDLEAVTSGVEGAHHHMHQQQGYAASNLSFKTDEPAAAQAQTQAQVPASGFNSSTKQDISGSRYGNGPKFGSFPTASSLDGLAIATNQAYAAVRPTKSVNPKSWAKLLTQVRRDPAVATSFRDVTAAFNLVFLGSTQVGTGVDTGDEDEDAWGPRLQGTLRKVVLSGTLPRAATLILAKNGIGIVDRQFRSEVIAKYSYTSIMHHAMKKLDVDGKVIHFIVLVGRNKVFQVDTFYVLECKPVWAEDKVAKVWSTLSGSIRAAQRSRSPEDEDAAEDLYATGNAFAIPKFAKVHQIKYIGSKTIKGITDTWNAINDVLSKPQVKHTKKTKGMQQSKPVKKSQSHLLHKTVDFAVDAMLVVAPGFTRILDRSTLEVLVTILPGDVQYTQAKDLTGGGPVRRGNSDNAATLSEAINLSGLDPVQAKALTTAVNQGELSEIDAIKEAGKAVKMQAEAVGMVWVDQHVGVLRCEVIVAEGEDHTSTAKAICNQMNAAKEMADKRDPFAPQKAEDGEPGAGITALVPLELDRSNVLAVKMVGSGFFGEVYLASELVTHDDNDKDEEIRRAVKTLRPGANPSQAKDFLAEAAVQAPLDHPGICKITGVCTMQSPYLCIFEFIQYGDLQGLLQGCVEKNVTITYAEQLDMAHQVADALTYIHSKNLVHLDIAARNILVGQKSVMKIADFGLTRPYDLGTKGFRLRGKMTIPQLYAPPETFPPIIKIGKNIAARGDLVPVYSEDSDVWAFGVTLWEIVTYGEKPYGHGMGLIDILKKIYFNGLRLEMPEGTPDSFTTLMDDTFNDPGKRPSFSQICTRLQGEIEIVGGQNSLRDIGVLVNSGLEQTIQRASAQASDMRSKMLSQLARSPSKWGKVRTMIPFFSMTGWKQFEGKLVRVPGKLSVKPPDRYASEHIEDELADFFEEENEDDDTFGFDENPYDTDDSEFDDFDDDFFDNKPASQPAKRKRTSAQFMVESVEKQLSTDSLEDLDDDAAIGMFVRRRSKILQSQQIKSKSHAKRRASTIVEESGDSIWA